MPKPILSRLFVAILGVALLFATTPSIAAMECCDPVSMAMQMADAAHHGTVDQNNNMPCKMPAGTCTSVCASMASVALTAPQFVLAAPANVDQPIMRNALRFSGISQPPDLPPPITLA